MKLDLDLIRDLLIKIESGFDILENVDQSSVEDDRISFHCRKMVEHGLINAEFDGPYVVSDKIELRWEGQDFLDDIQSNGKWRKIKAKLKKVLGTVSLEVVKELAKGIA